MSEVNFEYRSDKLREIESDETDPFGHRDYANTVVAELDHFPSQFTLGLFGDWGSGKSTILKEIGRRLDTDKETNTAFVIFDAWRYEGDSLRREFIRTVGEELSRQGALRDDFDFERHIEGFETETTVSERRLKFDSTALRDGAIAAVLVVMLVAALILLLPKLGLSAKTTLEVLIAISSAATAFMLFALQRVALPDPVQATRRRLEFPDQFAANFRELLANVTAERMVIAVDNLDRCSPARVTEILSSVKTFLEPAFEEGPAKRRSSLLRRARLWLEIKEESSSALESMCFIIAADDAALRRHLTAQELSKSGWRGSEGPAQGGAPGGAQREEERELPPEVRASVEEYLRKFFGASLRIRELLDEDIRRFTAEELKEFNDLRELDKELAARLVEMTAQGLKRNPRRIKQFVNNLQMRLQMLAERSRQKRVQIEPEVLTVAKLAIIEEEFVEAYEQLQKDPTLLASWHTQARASDGDEQGLLDPNLAAFLRSTDDIQPPDIRAYLNLKQTRAELDLPRHGEFVAMLDDGDVGRIGNLLSEEGGEETRYTAAALAHFGEQRAARAWSRAHNTLRSIIEVPLLHGEGGVAARETLEAALQEPNLEERLSQLEPESLLNVAIRYELTADKRRRILSQTIDALGSGQAPDSRRAAAEALAGHLGAIEESGRGRIKKVLSEEEVRTDFESYLPLARELPEAIGSEILDAALSRIEELGTDGVSSQSPPFLIAVTGLRDQQDASRVERLLVAARGTLGVYLESGSEDLGPVAAALTRVVEGSDATPAMSEMAGWLAANRAAIPINAHPAALSLAQSLCAHSPEADTNAGAAIGDWLFELEGEETLSRLQGFDTLSSNLRSRVSEIISEILAGEPRNLTDDQLNVVLGLFSESEQEEIKRGAISLAISRERPEVAGALLSSLGEGEQQQVLSDSLARAEGAPAAQIGDTKFVIAQGSRIEEDQLLQLALQMSQLIFADRGTVQQLAPVLANVDLESAERRLKLVEHILHTEEDMSDPANREVMLRAAWSVAGRPASKAKEAITARLNEVKSQAEPDTAQVAGELLGAS